ncbi:MAG: hypothetical protein J1F64_08205 [Oscillospiraceae bacterium]|nr:hypothetical protein [Oscillospiraceae bacterium]
MKKTISIVLAAVMMMSLASCKKKNNDPTGSPTPTTAASAEPSAAAGTPASDAQAADTTDTPINGGSLNEQNAAGVKQDGNNVNVTLPADFFDENTSTELNDEMKAQGYQRVTKNPDGSVTYVITNSGYKKLKDDMKKNVTDYFKEVKSGDEFKSIKDVQSSDDFSEVKITVDREAFESSRDVIASRAIYMIVAGYRIFCGEDVNSVKVNIIYIDESNNSEIASVVYPDALSAKN